MSISSGSSLGDGESGLALGETTAALLVSVVIPCLNEKENIELCVSLALSTLSQARLPGEVIVADNGSVDGSADLAESSGARVVSEPRRGTATRIAQGFAPPRGLHRDGRRRSDATTSRHTPLP